jgi:hypothetical protein
LLPDDPSSAQNAEIWTNSKDSLLVQFFCIESASPVFCLASGDGLNVHVDVKMFSAIEPLNDGVVEVEFQPIQDYALVNAIAVTQE